jgi:hypothetical protein
VDCRCGRVIGNLQGEEQSGYFERAKKTKEDVRALLLLSVLLLVSAVQVASNQSLRVGAKMCLLPIERAIDGCLRGHVPFHRFLLLSVIRELVHGTNL